MNVEQLIASRRTVHRYLPSEITETDLHALFEAAHQAPCHKKTWPWRFYVCGEQTREAFIRLAIELKSQGGELVEERKLAIRNKLANPAAMILVGQQLADDPFRRKEDYAAVSCALQNMMLMAHHLGYGSKWSTGGFTRHSKAYDIVSVNPEEIELVGCMFIGEAAMVPSVERPPVDGFVTTLS